RYAEDHRLRLVDALTAEDAQGVHQLVSTIPYALMVSVGGQGQSIEPSALNQMNDTARTRLQQQIYADASRGVGFAYEGHQLGSSTNPALTGLLEKLNGAETLDRVRHLTGVSDITHADGQATRYRGGHFLTRHLDDPQGEQRRIAYVLSMTANWHPDWGGLLQFYERDGTPRDAWSPGFNTLSLFHTHHVHAVTFVAPFAAAPRLSVTGWFRAGEPA
ncbi:MAG: 2OG-Fe(II) oxygenase family protein, partial [Pseudomonadota bacterium]